MNKQSMFTMKLEAELHAAFKSEAEAVARPAAQIVRELMREFVTRQKQQREHEEFAGAKVAAARQFVRDGNGILNDDVEAEFARRRTEAGFR